MINKIYLWWQWIDTGKYLDVIFPFNQEKFAQVCLAWNEEIEKAIRLAKESFEQTKKLEPYEKANILKFIVNKLKNQLEDFSQTLVLENGKTIKEARWEMIRCINTYETAIWETERIYWENYDLWVTQAAKWRFAIIKKFPIWIVAWITPFNFPMNLAAHKIAPAIACWCPIIIKPASATPLTSLMLAKIIEESWWPKWAFSVLPCDRHTGQQLVEDERIALLSFTWSPDIWWKMKKECWKKKVVLELWWNAALIVENEMDNLDFIIQRTVFWAYYQAGQSCISVQKIFVHKDIYEKFKEKLIKEIAKLKIWDPRLEENDIWWIIDLKNKQRLTDWIDESIDKWATCLIWNKWENTILFPTLIENVSDDSKINNEEVFWPIALLDKFDSIDEAISKINNSKFWLQVWIFSNNLKYVWKVFEECEVWWVIHNDVPSFRADNMPYWWIKDSGSWREWIKYAMRDMMEEKLLVINEN